MTIAGICTKKRIELRSGKVNIEEWVVCNNNKTTTFVIWWGLTASTGSVFGFPGAARIVSE